MTQSRRATFLALATVAALAGAPALAQQPGPGSGPGMMGQGMMGQGTMGRGMMGGHEMMRADEMRGEARGVDRGAILDARLAGIRVGLDLTDEQAALFEPVAQAWRAAAQAREGRREAMREERRERWEAMAERRDAMRRGEGRPGAPGFGPMMSDEEMRGAMREGARGDFMERLERRAAGASARAEEIGGLAQAMRPFWDSLDAQQQELLPVLVRELGGFDMRPRRAGMEHGMHGGMYGGMHHGMHGGGRGWH
ncbi:Spy/CpxP family protein refolding chaperone [Salinarimonas ramus]|uniref:LTXXQ motif family protein n=1 Tax=Salinarimonas ramus TaxID=690164 RepID=A0A917V3I0_9HYPH|nr:Spy/CpxP family protein refolding chaperone [Salinarimonas ramus]GGK30314.1 hypothetical protein GCM10011322_16090 [Salinarimonas ramus]